MVIGCSPEHSLRLDPKYAEQIGDTYVLTENTYIYRLYDNNEDLFLGRKISPNIGLFMLPDEVRRSNIGHRFKSIVIVDVVDKGTSFEIIDFIETRTFENHYTHALARINEGQNAGEYRLAYVLNRNLVPPEISPLFATKINNDI